MLVDDQALPTVPTAEQALEQPRLTFVRRVWQHEWAVVLLLAAWAAFILFWRLDVPNKYIYDEVYHAYTGNLMAQNDPKVYEWWESAPQQPIEGVQYEWTHPPLGKLIIGGSILLFGNNSLGWRFANALFGLVCVLLMYVLARQLFRDRLLATVATALISVEGLMFAESRIGTNDIFQLAFLLAAYICFARFLQIPARSGIGWLFAAGVFLGLGFGVKWPSMYSIMLLTAIAIVRGVWPESWTRRLTAPAAEVEEAPLEGAPNGSEEPPEANPVVLTSAHYTEASLSQVSLRPIEQPGTRLEWGVLGRLAYLPAAFVATVLVPVALYMASYIQMFLQRHQIPPEYAGVGPFKIGPFSTGEATLPNSGWWDMFVGEQWQMWRYHTTLTAGHPYYSKWWQWLLDLRPVFYYVDRQDGWVANTYNLGNPLLYWGFSIAIVLSLWLIWSKRDLRLAFVLGAFLINWLPWSLSPRGLFFYHFLPSVPFLVLLVAYCLVWLYRRPERRWQHGAAIYVGVVFLSFAFFYTQLAAWTVPEWYADIHFWLPSWQ